MGATRKNMRDLPTTSRLRPRFPQRLSVRRKAGAPGTSVSKTRTSRRGSPKFLKAGPKGLREHDEHEAVPIKRELHIVKEHVRRTNAFARIEDATAAMRAGKMVI